MVKIPELKIGARIDIVFENEINKSNAHYMKASVYDYTDKNIIISQTSPALNRHFLNRRMLVTFLAHTEKRVVRFGLPALFTDLIADYRIASDKSVEALILQQKGNPEQIDFRMNFRVKLPSQSNIRLFFKEEKVNLIDISAGGAKFSCPRSHSFAQGDTVQIKLVIDTTAFNMKARVRSISMPEDLSARTALQFVGIEFEHDNRQLDAILGRAIINIERQLLSEGKMG